MIDTRQSFRRGVLLGSILGFAGGSVLSTVAFQGRDLLADQDTRDAITTVKREIVPGHKSRDRASLERLYADDYTATDSKGMTRTKADLLANLKADAEIVEGRYDLRSVRRWGNLAVASGHGRLVYPNADGSTRISEYDSCNVFERHDGRWLYAAAFLP